MMGSYDQVSIMSDTNISIIIVILLLLYFTDFLSFTILCTGDIVSNQSASEGVQLLPTLTGRHYSLQYR